MLCSKKKTIIFLIHNINFVKYNYFLIKNMNSSSEAVKERQRILQNERQQRLCKQKRQIEKENTPSKRTKEITDEIIPEISPIPKARVYP